jgi:hypothetical protein
LQHERDSQRLSQLNVLRFLEETTPKPSDIPITFLRNYTDPTLQSVSDAYLLSAAHAEPPEEPDLSFNKSVSYIHDDYMDDLFSGVFSDIYANQDTGPVDPTSPPVYFPLSPPTARIEQLLSLLATQYASNPNAFTVPVGHFPTNLARAVFTGNNIAQFVTAFFTYFHPHTPFIHRPSFNIETVTMPLLLAISLLGSVFAAPQDDALSARYFFELGEEYAFGLLHHASTADSYTNDERIQILQAAVLMHALQMDSNNAGIRLRIRTHRFPAIVAALRRLDMFGTVRTAQSRPADWSQFVADEVKIRYKFHLQQLLVTVLTIKGWLQEYTQQTA